MDLYIAQRSDHEALQIGRSSKVHDRVQQLSKGHIFEINLIDVFEEKGPMERFVHIALNDCRITGTEWFTCDLETARKAINNAQYYGRKANPRYHAAYRLRKGISLRSTKYLDLNIV